MSLLVIDWETFIDPPRDSALPDTALSLSVGVFDGVHRGHQRLIAKIREYAGEHGGRGGVITFCQNPRRVLHPKNYPGDIYSLSQKIRTLEGLGAAFAVLIDFSGDFSRMSGKEFAALLRKRRIDYLAVGANFRCGYRLDTGARSLREMMAEGGTLTELVAPLKTGGANVSSSRIRESILRGDLAGAAELLGRPYSLDLDGLCPAAGGVISWDLGKEGRLLPPGGSYRVFVRAGGMGFPAEISLDSGRLSLRQDEAPPGFLMETGLPPPAGDFLNGVSVEFGPLAGPLTGSQ
jgi:riboflavin kinase/FMN adenylyltransferase